MGREGLCPRVVRVSPRRGLCAPLGSTHVSSQPMLLRCLRSAWGVGDSSLPVPGSPGHKCPVWASCACPLSHMSSTSKMQVWQVCGRGNGDIRRLVHFGFSLVWQHPFPHMRAGLGATGATAAVSPVLCSGLQGQSRRQPVQCPLSPSGVNRCHAILVAFCICRQSAGTERRAWTVDKVAQSRGERPAFQLQTRVLQTSILLLTCTLVAHESVLLCDGKGWAHASVLGPPQCPSHALHCPLAAWSCMGSPAWVYNPRHMA